MKVLLVLCIITYCIPTFANIPLSGWTSGRSTYYTTPDNGECGYGYLPIGSFPYRHIGAANTAFYSNALSCGNCYEIQCLGSDYLQGACTGQNVIIQITDECPAQYNTQWCSGDITHFDLSTDAFNVLANPAAGVIKTQFRQVTCDVSGNIQYKIKDGANAWWFALLVENVGGHGGIQNVEVKGNGGAWISMQRQSYNYWIAQFSGNGLATPASIRVTSTSGAQITDTNIISYVSSGAVFTSSQQFAYNSYNFAPSSVNTNDHSGSPIVEQQQTDVESGHSVRSSNSINGMSTGATVGLICVAVFVGIMVGAGVAVVIMKKKQSPSAHDYTLAPL